MFVELRSVFACVGLQKLQVAATPIATNMLNKDFMLQRFEIKLIAVRREADYKPALFFC
jgi:hypothetical protein